MDNQNTNQSNQNPPQVGVHSSTPNAQNPVSQQPPASVETPMPGDSTPTVPVPPPPSPASPMTDTPEQKPAGSQTETGVSSGGKGKFIMMGLVALFLVTTAVLGYVYWTTQNNSAANTENSQAVQVQTSNNAFTVTESEPTDASQVELGEIDSELNSIDTDLKQL